MTGTIETCPKMISTGAWTRPTRCGRLVKRDGLCGIHANAADKEREKDAAYRAKITASAEGKAIAERYIARLGVGRPHREDYQWIGGVVLSRDDLRDLLACLDGEAGD